ncbi:group II intron reverse transcriptase/maturase [Bacillus cereus]|uniref:group II intron reverse transcriptase/maturase n=1 Tax=Bacillus cereus TaxID=1396 RepID=UPI001909E8D0|nr:group II intron reverse transcriptase/maturase [Bacillus cereus]MBK4739889.1 group II intron reverse transcriptase/maturase [Bacillus cereus]
MTMNKVLKNNKLRYAEYYGQQTEYDLLYEKSRDKTKPFKYLFKKVISDDNLLLAYRSIKSNKGSNTVGSDGLSIEDVAELSIDEYLEKIRTMLNNYQPKAVRRVEIPKPNGKKRPLGIPCIWDRIIQQAILQVLEPICEAKFHPSSYGFRPNCSSRNAMAKAVHMVNRGKMYYVVDIDIKGFFDEVNHRKLMKQLWSLGIHDKKLLSIIKAILRSPVKLPDMSVIFPKKGTPQGGILSPLLANVVLNEFDWWIADQWEGRRLSELKISIKKDGLENTWGHRNKLRKTTRLKEMYIVRYADDFKLFTNSHENAMKIFYASKMWLEERLHLPISTEKSKVTNLKKEDSEFLGFTIRAVKKGRDNKGNWKYIAHTHVTDKSLERVSTNLKEQIKNIQRSPNSYRALAGVMKYNAMVIGIHQYYETATHVASDFRRMQDQVTRAMYNRFAKADKRNVGFKSNGFTNSGKYVGKNKGLLPYMKSKRVHYYMCYPVLPVGYVKHRNPMQKSKDLCKYTEKGRALIHKKQMAVPEKSLQWLREHPVIGPRTSVEFNDNRISLYVAQYGKCAVTGKELEAWEIHCHHKIPWSVSHDDSYKNLVIVSQEIHKLIHAKKSETISKYLNLLKLTDKELIKVNELRKIANEEEISDNINKP